MIDLYTYINEGLLRGMEDTLDKGQEDLDAIAMQGIENKLKDQNLYYIHNINKNRPDYEIKKVRGKWVVDVNGDLTVYGMGECVTDGSFSFGVVKGQYMISCGWDNKIFKSLQYGPKEVQSHMMIYWGENLKSLQYCPKTIHGDFELNATGIETLKYFPDFVHGRIRISDCMKLKDFTKLHKCHVGQYIRIFHNGAKTTEEVAKKILDKWDVTGERLCQFDYNVKDYR